jgi:RIO-like serine/threonine protein kinase
VDKERQDATFFDSLHRIVAAMHERGVVHLDLRQRRNILIRPDGTAAVIDFGAALCLRPGSPLLRRLARIDDSGVLKYKQRARPGSLTADEAARLARVERRRALWPFG